MQYSDNYLDDMLDFILYHNNKIDEKTKFLINQKCK